MEDQTALFRLRAMIVDGCRISWEVPHAKQRANERHIPLFAAERIIRQAQALRITMAGDGTQTWRVSGFDPDERPIDVVVFPASQNTLRVITVIRTDE
jgi:hypothetical protein